MACREILRVRNYCANCQGFRREGTATAGELPLTTGPERFLLHNFPANNVGDIADRDRPAQDSFPGKFIQPLRLRNTGDCDHRHANLKQMRDIIPMNPAQLDDDDIWKPRSNRLRRTFDYDVTDGVVPALNQLGAEKRPRPLFVIDDRDDLHGAGCQVPGAEWKQSGTSLGTGHWALGT